MSQNGTKSRLIEAEAPTIYTDGPAKVEIHGANARITYFEYRDLGDEVVMVPVLVIVMPASVVGSEPVVEMFRQARRTRRTISVVDETGVTAH